MTPLSKKCTIYGKSGMTAESESFLTDAFRISSSAVSDSGESIFVDDSFLKGDFSDNNIAVFPGFADVHVHLREPGFLYKETVETGSQAALQGGFAAVCTMPNLNPTPDSLENLTPQLDAIRRGAKTNVIPFGAITVGEKGEQIANLEELAPYVAGFSDDGRGVQNEDMMREVMIRAKKLGKIVSAHCEVNSLLLGGYIHDGEYAKAHCHRGISSESEWRMIERDLRLAKETGASYHVCHISAKESVSLIRRAKAEGVDVTAETAPHYLVFTDNDLTDDGRFKMNPPIRSAADREALIEGIIDGTVDMIATDHAPHSAEEKSRGLAGSLMGVVGLETSFAACYTHLVKKGIISLHKLIELMHYNPKNRFRLPIVGPLDSDSLTDASYTVFDLDAEYTVNPQTFATKGRATPFAGEKLFGKCLATRIKL